MSVRWECPNGKHPAVLAPQRPRKNDVRRYCLRCSETEGVLVERTAPSLERKRAAKTEFRKAKTQRLAEYKAARMEAQLVDATGVEHVVDLEALTRQALADMGYRKWVKVNRQRRPGVRGHAHPTLAIPEIHYSIMEGVSYERVLEMVYHEAAHVASGNRIAEGSRRWHGAAFRRTLADGLQKRWPFLVYGSVTGSDGAYAADERIVQQLQEHVLAGGSL